MPNLWREWTQKKYFHAGGGKSPYQSYGTKFKQRHFDVTCSRDGTNILEKNICKLRIFGTDLHVHELFSWASQDTQIDLAAFRPEDHCQQFRCGFRACQHNSYHPHVCFGWTDWFLLGKHIGRNAKSIPCNIGMKTNTMVIAFSFISIFCFPRIAWQSFLLCMASHHIVGARSCRYVLRASNPNSYLFV